MGARAEILRRDLAEFWQRTGRRGWLARFGLFAANFVRHPFMLGTPFPSPPRLIHQILAPLPWDRARVVVEYGPGVGHITREILRRLKPIGRLVAIETNRDFVACLREDVADPRLEVVDDSAERVRHILRHLGCGRADCVVSGIPFSAMPTATRMDIIRATREVLQPDGTLMVYQYSRKAQPVLEREFKTVHANFRWLGGLPIWLFHCQP